MGRKWENPEKNHLAHPQAELGLSYMCPMWASGLWTIRTFANSALVNSDPKNAALVNSDPDHWSIRTPTTGQFGPYFIGQFGPQLEKIFGQFGPFLLVNSDLFHWSIQTFSFGQFGPIPLVNLYNLLWQITTERPSDHWLTAQKDLFHW